jgi:hypothetical protein
LKDRFEEVIMHSAQKNLEIKVNERGIKRNGRIG